jgi:hypothetical protein
MATITLSGILGDLRAADQALHKLEQRSWISSADFYELYSQGKLDNGQHRADFFDHNRKPAPGIGFQAPNPSG